MRRPAARRRPALLARVALVCALACGWGQATAAAEAAPTSPDAHAGLGTAANATELSALLKAGREPVTLDEQRFERGCHGDLCSMSWQDLIFRTAPGGIRHATGRALRLVSHGADAKRPLPDLDWEPLAGYQVSVSGRRWGSCFELSHAGLGKSGSAQRWTSVILVPQGRAQAHRFVGYFSGCDALVQTAKRAEVALPMVSHAAAAAPGWQVVWQVCGARSCRSLPDARQVQAVADDPGGALVLSAKH